MAFNDFCSRCPNRPGPYSAYGFWKAARDHFFAMMNMDTDESIRGANAFTSARLNFSGDLRDFLDRADAPKNESKKFREGWEMTRRNWKNHEAKRHAPNP